MMPPSKYLIMNNYIKACDARETLYVFLMVPAVVGFVANNSFK
jgi:hypothetical protein